MAKRHLDEIDNYDHIASNSNLPEVVVSAPRKRNILQEWWNDISNYNFGKDIKNIFKDTPDVRHMVADLQNFGIIPKGSKDKNYSYGIAPVVDNPTGFTITPDYLVSDFVKRYGSKSKYAMDIAEDIFGLNPNLQIVDYISASKYGKIFNERIRKTLQLAKQRGTLRTSKEPNIVVADNEGRKILYDKFINDTPILPGRKEVIHAGDPVTSKGKLSKDYYYKTEPPTTPFDNEPYSFADRRHNTVVLVPKNGNYENMYKYVLPHEKTHIFIDSKKEAELFGTDRGLGAPYHEPGDYNINLDLYLARPDEQLARGTQIKNYLGITDDSPITSEQLKYAAENYVKDTGHNNNMTSFFSMIKDYDKAAKWLSLAPSILPISIGTAEYLYNNNNNYKFGGRRSLKSGGSIYIKPENRGNFNATKERMVTLIEFLK